MLERDVVSLDDCDRNAGVSEVHRRLLRLEPIRGSR